MSKWEEISDVLTKKGAEKLKIGQVLIFDYEGSPINLKVMRKRLGKVWAKRIYLYTEEQVNKEVSILEGADAIRNDKDIDSA